ncbi:MAG: M56 family metallopeptidase [Planctomycetia bacterium]|nr:M56 family metallopeptidase [Planctomycetia bacterium]
MHKLVHNQRRDLLWGWVAYVVLVFHWFNSLLWLAVRDLYADQEETSNVHLLALADGPGLACYAETLY